MLQQLMKGRISQSIFEILARGNGPLGEVLRRWGFSVEAPVA